MLFLESENPEKDISLYINRPGGIVTAGLAIYDTMQFIKPDVSTMCVGQAASMGALLLAAGAKGKRYALPNSRVMIHQPLGGAPGPGHRHRHPGARNPDHAPAPERDPVARTPASRSRQIARDTDRDNFMSARRRARLRPDRRGARRRPDESIQRLTWTAASDPERRFLAPSRGLDRAGAACAILGPQPAASSPRSGQ